MSATQPQPKPTQFPEFGTSEHMEWLARRLTRNLKFRAQLERRPTPQEALERLRERAAGRLA